MDGSSPGPESITLEPSTLRGARPPAGLYLHYPFCRRRCHYCDFSVATSAEPRVEEWLKCVERDLSAWFAEADWEPPLPLKTVFVGGGTPSLLGRSGMTRVATSLQRWFSWEDELEWTAESNPNSLSPSLCEEWLDAGVNRLSIGVQSFDGAVLRWLGRLHTSDEAATAVRTARGAGFDNLNVDLMFGLPDEVARDWPAEVAMATALRVSHISAYGLTVEPRTPLGRRVSAGRMRMPGERRYEKEYRIVASALGDAGYEHYEVSNFARPGYECRHNWQYWNGDAYLGVGPSAHSFLPPYRVWNVYRWDAYRRTVLMGGSPRAGAERVEGPAHELERLWLSLRTRTGLSASHPALDQAADGAGSWKLIEQWIEAGWLERRRDRVCATLDGWLRLDELVAACAARGWDQEDVPA